MGKCRNHPNRETNYLCSKHNVYMCEECLKCNDPEIYCKFRSACPIWFMERRKARWGEKKRAEEVIKKYKAIFTPEDKEIEVPEGSTLLDAAREADVHINASCNGKGSCGKCKLIFEAGNIKSEPTSLLSDKEKKRIISLPVRQRYLEML